MSYFVYQNWTRGRAVVHFASCFTCNGGRGVHAGKSRFNGAWHGPFEDKETALDFAQSLREPFTGSCSRCGA